MTHIATRDFELSSGKHCFAYGEVRYTFTVTPGRPAKTWAVAGGQFAPAERPQVEVTKIEITWGRGWGRGGKWMLADGLLLDMLAEVDDAWLLEQAAEDVG